MFRNHYVCPRCDNRWADTWPCQVDDDCPQCGARHIPPAYSDDDEPCGVITDLGQRDVTRAEAAPLRPPRPSPSANAIDL